MRQNLLRCRSFRRLHAIGWGFVLSLLVTLSARSQPIPISGTVTDEKNEPLQGVVVTEKNGKATVVTDSKGHFTLSTSTTNAVLSFSFVGYGSQDLPVEKNKVLAVKLLPVNKALDEAIVIGYGTVKRRDLTGSVGQVTMKDLDKAPVRSFDEALAGRVAGVSVASNDGQPGSPVNIVIRGGNSLTQDNSPLYVIDGFPIENPNNNALNPAEIESIEVLKDASATAIYGARGANGVIIITTKRGKSGPPVISYNGYYGLQSNLKKMDVMGPYDYIKLQEEMDPINTPLTYFANGQTLDSYKDSAKIDWQSMAFRKAPMQSHSLLLTGGDGNTRYTASGSIVNQEGTIINSGYNRYQGQLSLDKTVNEKLKVGFNANYSSFLQYGSTPSSTYFTSSLNLMYSLWGSRPVSAGGDILNNLFDPTLDITQNYQVNPILELKNEVRNARNRNLIANGYASYDITRDLVLRVTGGLNTTNTKNEVFNNSQTIFGNTQSPQGNLGVNGSLLNIQFNNWVNENTLTYTKVIHTDHTLNVLAGFTQQGYTTSTNGAQGSNLPNESLGVSGLDEGTPVSINSTSSKWFLASFLGRINYSYKSKYLLTGNFRADGSSKFSPANKWSYFPSGAFAWRISNESFMKNLTFISDAKVRASYGISGNNRVSDFAYLSTLGFGINYAYPFNNTFVNGSVPTVAGNNNLKWETTAQTDLGIDLSLFNQRVNFTADAYRKVTSNLLLNAAVPNSTGFDNIYKNIGKISNQGLEFSIATRNIQTKKFSWSSEFNISFNRSKVLALTQNQESLLTNVSWDQGYTNPLYIAKIGQPVAQFYGYLFDGVYQYSAFDKSPTGAYTLKANQPTNGKVRTSILPGDIKFRDINGDGIVNNQDLTVIGNPNPIHTGGFSNNFTYGNFDLNVFLQWSYGNDVFDANRQIFEIGFRPYLNQFAADKNRWEPDNPSNLIPRANNGDVGGSNSSRVVENGSYLRLKTVALGYNLSNDLIRKAHFKSLRVYVSTQNLYTWTKYKGYDPEVSVRNSALTPGFDYSSYPRARTLVFGLNASF